MSELDLVKEQNRDSEKWAQAFCEQFNKTIDQENELDEGWVHSWFANAMMVVSDSIFNNEIKEIQRKCAQEMNVLEKKYNQAFGWMYAEACSCMDMGLDIRKMEVPEIFERMKEELGEG